jgi:hypothetical protein
VDYRIATGTSVSRVDTEAFELDDDQAPAARDWRPPRAGIRGKQQSRRRYRLPCEAALRRPGSESAGLRDEDQRRRAEAAKAASGQAIELGLARTGRLVTSAALILMFAFVVLSTSPGCEIKPLEIGLAAGIILDATVIRAVLVPALMRLLGDANWWMPRWTRVAASRLPVRAGAGERVARDAGPALTAGRQPVVGMAWLARNRPSGSTLALIARSRR